MTTGYQKDPAASCKVVWTSGRLSDYDRMNLYYTLIVKYTLKCFKTGEANTDQGEQSIKAREFDRQGKVPNQQKVLKQRCIKAI